MEVEDDSTGNVRFYWRRNDFQLYQAFVTQGTVGRLDSDQTDGLKSAYVKGYRCARRDYDFAYGNVQLGCLPM